MSECPPVLLLAFNRPERLAQLIDRVREVRPARVFVAIDGPRHEVSSDHLKVRETHDQVGRIDWACTVETLNHGVNLGCGRAVSTAITWFMSQVPEGIILEDDVLPDPSFFEFSATLLDRYRDDDRVFAISGCNFAPRTVVSQAHASYRFSGITHVWGWATWHRAWSRYRYSMSEWRTRLRGLNRWRAMGGDLGGYVYWSAVFDWVRFGHVDTWDYQWSLAQMIHGGLTATSNTNLTENVGFTGDSTHTTYRPPYVQGVVPMDFPLVHPDIRRDVRADRWVRRQILASTTANMTAMARDNVMQRASAMLRPARRVTSMERG